METKFDTSLGSLSGKIESLETVMQPPSSLNDCIARQDDSDGKVRIAVTVFEQYVQVMKQCLKNYTPVLDDRDNRNGTTSKWIRALDDAKQSAGNVGDVDDGDPAVYVEQAKTKVRPGRYFPTRREIGRTPVMKSRQTRSDD
jgi:hypothetical protein